MNFKKEVLFKCVPFEKLSKEELYHIMALRQEVFVIEQNCVYQDADGLDLKCWHLAGFNKKNKAVAYARLIPKGLNYTDYPAIGRIATAREIRGTGIGKELVQLSIEYSKQLFGNIPIKISAQCYLKAFYESFGFQCVGEEYLEDGIPHIGMVL